MPAKFRVKKYKPEEIYYIYSTAGEGRNVFEDEVDFENWISLMERYAGGLIVKDSSRYKPDRPYRIKRKEQMSLAGEVTILGYCLLRRRIHLLIRQKTADGITKLMRRMVTNYTMYVNRRHRQKGKLFSGVYKGVVVSSGEKLVYLSRFLHLLPILKSVKRFGLVETVTELSPEEYLYSSYGKYLLNSKNEWFNPEVVLKAFYGLNHSRWKSYKDFVEDKNAGEETDRLMREFTY